MPSRLHQFLSYEDFIEGINLTSNNMDESSLTYRIEDGIFKRLCSVAENNNFDDPQEKRTTHFLRPIALETSGRCHWVSQAMTLKQRFTTLASITISSLQDGGTELTAIGLNRDEIDVKFEGMANFHAMAMKRLSN